MCGGSSSFGCHGGEDEFPTTVRVRDPGGVDDEPVSDMASSLWRVGAPSISTGISPSSSVCDRTSSNARRLRGRSCPVKSSSGRICFLDDGSEVSGKRSGTLLGRGNWEGNCSGSGWASGRGGRCQGGPHNAANGKAYLVLGTPHLPFPLHRSSHSNDARPHQVRGLATSRDGSGIQTMAG